MSHRMPRPGVLEVRTDGREPALACLGLFAALCMSVIGFEVTRSGWDDDLWGVVGVLALLAGGIVFLLRARGVEITREGIRTLGSTGPPSAPGRVQRLRLSMEGRGGAHSNSAGSSKWDFVLDVVLDTPGIEGEADRIHVETFADEAAARRAAEAIARHMTWPLEDAIGDAPELREPDALDQTAVPGLRGLVLVSDDAAIRIASGLDVPALEWLRAWICSQPR